jgi:hypothetical protein
MHALLGGMSLALTAASARRSRRARSGSSGCIRLDAHPHIDSSSTRSPNRRLCSRAAAGDRAILRSRRLHLAEGLETADLQEARALLDALAS